MRKLLGTILFKKLKLKFCDSNNSINLFYYFISKRNLFNMGGYEVNKLYKRLY